MLIRANGAPVRIAEDIFVPAADGEALPEGAVIVSLNRFLAEKDALLARGTPLGVRLETSQSPAGLGGDVHTLAVIELHVPYFRDGRAYSWARLLRTRLGFTGELRVSGHVLKDQLVFYARVGVDCFELNQNLPVAEIEAALHEISLVYQPSVDGRQTILDLRAAQSRPANQAP
jgi:uncharacterized protein (DUF934 family)